MAALRTNGSVRRPLLLGTQLSPSLREELEEVSRSIPVDEGGGASLISVDWMALHGDLIEAISRRGLGERAHLIRRRSRDVADAFATVPIDMLHIDGNYDREAVEADVELFMPHMADGGLLVMDDVSWPTIRPVYESLVNEHELLLALTEKGVNLRAGDFANDFSILRVRKTVGSPT